MTLVPPLLLAAVHMDVLATIVPAIIAGAAAIFVLLPRPRPYSRSAGILLAALAILSVSATFLRSGAVNVETFLFYAFSGIAVVSGGMLVTQHNPARAALSFAVVILSTCGLFLMLAAPFLAAATIIIYAGAIIVTFLFVLMLAQQAGLGDADARSREPLLASITGFVLLGALIYVLQLSFEKNDTVQTIDQLLTRTREARGRVDGMSVNELGDIRTTLQEPLEKVAANREASHTSQSLDWQPIKAQIEGPVYVAESAEAMKNALDHLEHLLLQMRQHYGWVRPKSDGKVLMSDLSGPSANEAEDNLRYDAQGRPQMPAENTAYLGRSLFTDYLLPVELGGFLLLVAVVGSITIAHRRATMELPR